MAEKKKSVSKTAAVLRQQAEGEQVSKGGITKELRVVQFTLTEPMLGTVPKNPEVYREYIQTKKPDIIDEDESATVEKIEEKGWTGFHSDAEGLFIYDYMIKGFLKYWGNVLKDELKIKALRSKVNDFCFVSPRRIYLGKTEPDGVLERPLRAMTMQGPRVSLVRSDYVSAGTTFIAEIELIPHPELKWPAIETLLRYGEYMGLGQFRNGSYGRFTIEVA